MSRERVRQVEREALDRLRQWVTEAARGVPAALASVRRMLTGSKIADSTITSRVASETSDDAPPMTPAIPSGPFASAISRVSASSSRST